MLNIEICIIGIDLLLNNLHVDSDIHIWESWVCSPCRLTSMLINKVEVEIPSNARRINDPNDLNVKPNDTHNDINDNDNKSNNSNTYLHAFLSSTLLSTLSINENVLNENNNTNKQFNKTPLNLQITVSIYILSLRITYIW